MELNITQEHVDEIMEKVISEQVGNVIENDWYGTVESRIQKEVERAVKNELAKRFNEMVAEIVDGFMNGKPFELNDGWGHRSRYESYTDFFAAQLNDRVSSSYEVKRVIEDHVKKKVDALWKTFQREIAEEVIARHAEGEEAVSA